MTERSISGRYSWRTHDGSCSVSHGRLGTVRHRWGSTDVVVSPGPTSRTERIRRHHHRLTASSTCARSTCQAPTQEAAWIARTPRSLRTVMSRSSFRSRDDPASVPVRCLSPYDAVCGPVRLTRHVANNAAHGRTGRTAWGHLKSRRSPDRRRSRPPPGDRRSKQVYGSDLANVSAPMGRRARNVRGRSR
jgi:hypothetical protein